MLTLLCVVLAVMLSRPNADQGLLQGLLVVATAMLLLGLAFTGFLAMTTMKELGGLASHPPRYKV